MMDGKKHNCKKKDGIKLETSSGGRKSNSSNQIGRKTYQLNRIYMTRALVRDDKNAQKKYFAENMKKHRKIHLLPFHLIL